MLDTLLSAGMPLRFFIAFIVVLGLIGGTAYVVRRFGGQRLGGGSARGRQPRLAVIDAAPVDGRRRLILIRRDNIEHLLMIGGPSDVVIEPNIVRAAAAQREMLPQRPPTAPETLPRAVPLGEGTMWPLQPHAETASPAPLPPRAQRPIPSPDETVPWSGGAEPPPPSPTPRHVRPPDPLAGLAAELSRAPTEPEPGAPPSRPAREGAREGSHRESVRAALAERQRMEPRPEPRIEPRIEPRMAPRPEPEPSPEQHFGASADQNLAEMAQRLEAALRRPAKGRDPRPAAPEMTSEPDFAPEPPMQPPALPESKPGREAHSARTETPKGPQKSLYDNLEQEMASLLGRPNNKT